mgnify:FL=1|jgi:hypothetical protein
MSLDSNYSNLVQLPYTFFLDDLISGDGIVFDKNIGVRGMNDDIGANKGIL